MSDVNSNTEEPPEAKSVTLRCSWYYEDEKDMFKFDPEPALFATLTTFGRPDEDEDEGDKESERHQCTATECLTVKTATAVSRMSFYQYL